MPDTKNSVGKTFQVALILCLVCSFFVSGAAILLRPKQAENRLLDKRGNILSMADIAVPSDPKAANRVFEEQIQTRYVELETGQFVDTTVVGADYDEREAARNPDTSHPILPEADLADIKRRPKYMPVYFLMEQGVFRKLILPVYGRGLWSTLYGFLALGSDLNTVEGISFYQHGETPGLGGEVDNERWKDQWRGKIVYDESGSVRLSVARGAAARSGEQSKYEVDGLSGATITAQGVDGLVKFWLGKNGFGPLLSQLKERGVSSGN